MKGQVLSIEQMLELEELGVDTSNASMIWNPHGFKNKIDYDIIVYDDNIHRIVDDKLGKLSGDLAVFNLIPTFTLQDIIDILPQYIEEKEIGRFDYELRVKKDEITYESYDAFDKEGEPYVLNFYTIDYDGCNSILDCAFEMLKWCIKEKYIEDERTDINS